jgi:hypothetical protein
MFFCKNSRASCGEETTIVTKSKARHQAGGMGGELGRRRGGVIRDTSQTCL